MNISKDGVLRHPTDFEAWKTFDQINESFATDSHNIRLGLTIDGFNTFKNMSNSYNIGSVILFSYNLSPCMCMKQLYLFLSLLISGPKAHLNDIDVFLGPLIDELKNLWEKRACTFDASMKVNFQMRAAVL